MISAALLVMASASQHATTILLHPIRSVTASNDSTIVVLLGTATPLPDPDTSGPGVRRGGFRGRVVIGKDLDRY